MSNPQKSPQSDGPDLASMKPSRVAIVGYGPEAREQALRLRAAGHHVAIGVRPGGMSWLRATADGFSPASAGAAIERADVVVLLVPDEDQPAVYWRIVAPNLAAGALLVFERGHAIYTGALEPEHAVDVVLVTGAPLPDCAACRVAVHHDATGNALDRAIAYARAAFGDDAKALGTTTVAEEVEAELEAFEDRVGGPEALLVELDRVLVRGTHEPDEAKLGFYERLRAVVARRVGTVRSRASGSREVVAPPASPSTAGLLSTMQSTRLRGVA